MFTYYHVDKWGNLVAVDLLPYIVAAVVSIVLICCVVSLVRRVLANPFHYPYFVERFDVSGRRNVKIDDLIDRFMLEPANWEKIVAERSCIQEWKAGGIPEDLQPAEAPGAAIRRDTRRRARVPVCHVP